MKGSYWANCGGWQLCAWRRHGELLLGHLWMLSGDVWLTNGFYWAIRSR